MPKFTLRIDGMHCASCVRRVSQSLASIPGVVVEEVTVGTAKVSSAEQPVPLDAAIAALAEAGFVAHLES